MGGWTPKAAAATSARSSWACMRTGSLRFAGKVGSGFERPDPPPAAVAPRAAALRPRPRSTRPRTRRTGDAGVGTSPGSSGSARSSSSARELGGWSRDGMVRQASFKGLDLGRDAREVAREHAALDPTDAARPPAAVPAPTAAPAAPGRPWSATEEELAALAAMPGAGHLAGGWAVR